MSSSADLHFAHEGDCLVVRALTRHIILEKEVAIKAIAAAIADQPIKAALVDLRAVPGPYTFMDYYQLGELTGRYLSGTPIAALVRVDQPDPDRIGKVVARNRGANIEVFTDQAEAQAWLKKYLAPVD